MRKPFFPDEFIDYVARIARVSANKVRSADKHRIYVRTRAIAYVVMRERGLSFKKIASYFDRDHSTVLHAVQTFDRYADDMDVQAILRIARRYIEPKQGKPQ